MRSEAEMYKLLTDIANADDRILAVCMNGSRTKVNVSKDIFQDYDIVYVVPETKSFIEDSNWISQFGNILPNIPESTDEDYYVKRLSETQFQACANEFWWCSNNIAKGLCAGKVRKVSVSVAG